MSSSLDEDDSGEDVEIDDILLDDGGNGEWNPFDSNILDSSQNSTTSGCLKTDQPMPGSPSLRTFKTKRQISATGRMALQSSKSTMGSAKFRKEISYNKSLPYYEKLSIEADEQLAVIKAGLGRSVLMREVRPALLHWACELDKYIYLHGYRFSKDDHLKFVRLFYEMTVTPNLELRLVKTFAHVLLVLLRNKELLSRDDLILDWRPLYDLYEFVAFKQLEEDGLFLIPKDISSGLENLIRQARTYFSVESTQEILDMVRPLLCPWDMTFSRGCQVMALFLPTNLAPSDHAFDSRDPRKLHWFVDILLDLAKKPMDGSFNAASRYFLLQGGINQQEWRVLEVWHDLYAIIEPHLAQPYQNLRDRLGSCLSTVFWFDLPDMTVGEGVVAPPKRAAFLDEINKKLRILWTEVEKGTPDEISAAIDLLHKSPERKDAILLLKTVLCYFNTHWSHSYVSAPAEIVQFLPLLCYFENETTDEELKRDCHWQFLNGLARALLKPENAGNLFDTLVKASTNKWWKSRVSVLQFLRVTLISNLFYFWTDEFKGRIFELLTTLLRDPQLEVREAASDTLSGLLHCRFISIDQDLTKKFKSWANDKTPLIRHVGVLGLAAVVKSCPYTVPAYLPDVLMSLCPHVNDKQQPVQSAVKKTLQEFKRTHYDCWHEHKEQFTDDQLAVLTDLLVSPNYYV